MAVSSKQQIRLIVANDTGFKSKLFDRDDTVTHEVTRTDSDTVSSGVIVADIADGAQTLSKGDISTVRQLYIEVAGAVTLTWGTLIVSLPISSDGTTSTTARFYMETSSTTAAPTVTATVDDSVVSWVMLGSE